MFWMAQYVLSTPIQWIAISLLDRVICPLHNGAQTVKVNFKPRFQHDLNLLVISFRVCCFMSMLSQ